MSPQLPGIFATLAPVLNSYGYLGVGALVLVEDFGVPAPGETVLIAAALYAGAGQLNIVLVGLVAFVAAVVGDNIGYGIGRFGGHRLVLRWGRYVFLTRERLDRASAFFDRHGGKVVTIARFIEGLRQANGIIAGITWMRWTKFLLFNAIGAALWVGLWSSLGYLAGNHLTTIYDQAHRYEAYLAVAVALVVVALAVHQLSRRRARRRSQAEAKSGG